MARKLPSLNGLKAFEAAARHESFTKAAEELCVTQGAVSHQVKALEAELGLKLFAREPQKLTLTQAGQDYLIVMRDAFDSIAHGTERLLKSQNSQILTLSISPNFASQWLIHRLGRFAEEHPDVDLRVSASMRHTDFTSDDVDIAIRHSDGNLPGLDVTKLYTETLFPVCSPDLDIKTPNDLARYPLLHLDSRDDWLKWLRAAGIEDIDRSRGPILNRATLIIDACVDGQGVALARTGLAAHNLLNGRLVRPFDIDLSVPYSYWIVCPKQSANLPKIKTFKDWVMKEARAEKARLDQLFGDVVSG
ncbi:transcriptional regulator GcvA [Terasakiella sp. A23]|uniref:transcriptional regulator GcvA n=1 Tax=Terasakiella sp. FCG-A23 TaxID=3080561 RepID=UPI002954740B|nr:transcriptional regulator GcvA [Terasakiella sp. A23]MDV7339764.1 transcriptional regulator GcvA [Terasakiella sp. A23]